MIEYRVEARRTDHWRTQGTVFTDWFAWTGRTYTTAAHAAAAMRNHALDMDTSGALHRGLEFRVTGRYVSPWEPIDPPAERTPPS